MRQSTDHMGAYWYTIPYSNKIDGNWGAESLLVAGCKLTPDLVRPFVESVRKWDLFFVIPGQKPDLCAVFQLRPRRGFGFGNIP